ncbi:hypothetical protein B0H16DRAFT_1718057 [Mycena metata]|uniref:Uncharacterized protein n=1 Tax=Mycena metata TaxID=1033252 RepID=A0AAD7NKW2_9AGAR|nr:hypothetical protein B0H16DRAFT_1718057 [Mycena metata]
MAAVGIWLWSNPSKFGQVLNPNCDPTLTVIGVPARFSSKPLRIVSLTMYSIALIPGLNLIPPFTFFLMLHISYNWSRKQHKLFWRWLNNTLDSMRKVVMPRKSSPLPDAEQGGRSQRSAAVSGSFPHTAFLIVGLVLLVAINVLFIVDIELTLRHNKGDQNGDAQWGFGQVLALLLLIIPLRDAWGALQDIWEKLEGVQKQFEELLLRECQATPVVEELRHLIQKEANPNLWSAEIRFGSALQLVACYGKIGPVQFLLNLGSVVLDKVGGDYGTALCAACANGKVKVVDALLQAGARRNGNGKHFGAPLHVAILVENCKAAAPTLPLLCTGPAFNLQIALIIDTPLFLPSMIPYITPQHPPSLSVAEFLTLCYSYTV